jgi:branched-subunit amino acid transport protein
MSWELIALLALVTYASRAVALVFLPSLPHRLRQLIDRMPPALFAALAAHSLVTPAGGFVDAQIIAATAAATLAAPLRSLGICLVAGVLAYLGWGLLGGG